MRVLISGGTGYLGGRLAVHLSGVGHQIVLGSRKPAGSPEWLPDAEMVQTKWNDLDKLSSICRNIDVVVHAAGMNAQDCLADPVAALDFNGIATGRFVLAAAGAGVKRFIYLSTAHVYASPLVGTITEAACPRNLHPYATSHLAGERAVLSSVKDYKIKTSVLRISNAIGAPVDKKVNCWSLFVNDICRQAVAFERMTLRSPADQERDFISISEVCRIIEILLTIEAYFNYDKCLNVGAGVSKTLLEISKLCQQRCEILLGFRPEIINEHNESQPDKLFFRNDLLIKNLGKVDADLKNEIDQLILFCSQQFTRLGGEVIKIV